MQVFEQVFTNHFAIVITGVLFFTLGIIIPKFKMYWLIAGLNGRPKKDIEKQYNLRYIEKYFGIFMLALGILTILNPIIWTALTKEENIGQTFVISTLLTVAFWFVFVAIGKKKIYQS
jgi:hypothetical protein